MRCFNTINNVQNVVPREVLAEVRRHIVRLRRRTYESGLLGVAIAATLSTPEPRGESVGEALLRTGDGVLLGTGSRVIVSVVLLELRLAPVSAGAVCVSTMAHFTLGGAEFSSRFIDSATVCISSKADLQDILRRNIAK